MDILLGIAIGFPAGCIATVAVMFLRHPEWLPTVEDKIEARERKITEAPKRCNP